MDDDDHLHPTPGQAPYLGPVPACGSKLRVVCKLVDKAGTVTRLSAPRQVQLAIVPEKEAFDAATGIESEQKTYDMAIAHWIKSQVS